MANLVRRVRTPQGAAYFGLPIGAVITADARLAAKEKHGGKAAPKGSTSIKVGKGTFDGQKPLNTKTNVEKQKSAVTAAKAALGAPGTAPGGPKSVSLGETQHAFPEGTKVARSKQFPGRIAYAQTPDGKTYRMVDEHINEAQGGSKAGIDQAFAEGGNAIMSPPVDIDADAYDPNTDPSNADFLDVATLGDGETLSNASGMKSFTKTGDVWVDNKGFGINNDAMQKMVDMGAFGQGGTDVPDAVDQPTNLYELLGADADMEDFAEYLDGLPNKQKVSLDSGETFTKTEGGDGADKWINDADATDVVDNNEIASLAPLVTLDKSPDTDDVVEEGKPTPDEAAGDADAPAGDADEAVEDDDPEASTKVAEKAAAEDDATAPDVYATKEELDALEEGDVVTTSLGEKFKKNDVGNWDFIEGPDGELPEMGDEVEIDSDVLANEYVDPVSIQKGSDEDADAEETLDSLKKKRDDAKAALDAAKKSGDQDTIDAAQEAFSKANKAVSDKTIADKQAQKAKENEGKSASQIAQEEYDQAKADADKTSKNTQSGSALQSEANDNVKAKKKALADALKAKSWGDLTPEEKDFLADFDAVEMSDKLLSDDDNDSDNDDSDAEKQAADAIKALDEAQAKKDSKKNDSIEDLQKKVKEADDEYAAATSESMKHAKGTPEKEAAQEKQDIAWKKAQQAKADLKKAKGDDSTNKVTKQDTPEQKAEKDKAAKEKQAETAANNPQKSQKELLKEQGDVLDAQAVKDKGKTGSAKKYAAVDQFNQKKALSQKEKALPDAEKSDLQKQYEAAPVGHKVDVKGTEYIKTGSLYQGVGGGEYKTPMQLADMVDAPEPKKTTKAKVTTPKVKKADSPEAPKDETSVMKALAKASNVGTKIALKDADDVNEVFEKVGPDAWQSMTEPDLEPFSNDKMGQYLAVDPQAITQITDEMGNVYDADSVIEDAGELDPDVAAALDAELDALNAKLDGPDLTPTIDFDLEETNVSLKGGGKDLKETNVSAVVNDAPEVTDPKKVQALRDSYSEEWMAKETLVFGKGPVTEETITSAPTGLILHGTYEGKVQKFVKLSNGLWFDGENGYSESDIIDFIDSNGSTLQHPNEVPGFKGIANAVPEKKTKAKVAKTYGDTVVEQNKDKAFSVGTGEDKYGTQKFLAESDENGLHLYVDGVEMTKEQILQAYTALNSHSAAQVTYGLYTMPSDNPLAEKGLINQFRDTALLRYPTAKPKAAALLTLKEAGGIQDAPILSPKGKKVLVGNFLDKKKNVQGPAYGFFSIDDLHDSVAILEGTQSKQFKSVLTYNLNAVGNIDPTKVTGGGPDKHENRQKFIDFLKNVLNTSALVPTKEQHVARLNGLKSGHVVLTRQGLVYTKQDNGLWTTPDVDGVFSAEGLFAKHGNSLTFVSQSKVPAFAFGPDKRMAVLHQGKATLYKRNLQGEWVKVFEDGEKGEKTSHSDSYFNGYDTREVFSFTTDNEDIVSYDPVTGEPVYYDAQAMDAEIDDMMTEVSDILNDDSFENENFEVVQKNVETDDAGSLATLAPASDIEATDPETGVVKIYVKDGTGNFVAEPKPLKTTDLLDTPGDAKVVVFKNTDANSVQWTYAKKDGKIYASDDLQADTDITGIDAFAKQAKDDGFWPHAMFVGDVMTPEDIDEAPNGTHAILDTTEGDLAGPISGYVPIVKGGGYWWHTAHGGVMTSGDVFSSGKAKYLLSSLPLAKAGKPDIEVKSVGDIPVGETLFIHSDEMPGKWMKFTQGLSLTHVQAFGTNKMTVDVDKAVADTSLGVWAKKSKSGFIGKQIIGSDAANEHAAKIQAIKDAEVGDIIGISSKGGVSVLKKTGDTEWTLVGEDFSAGPHFDDELMAGMAKADLGYEWHVQTANVPNIKDTPEPSKTPDEIINEHGSVTIKSEPVEKNNGLTPTQNSNETYLQENTDQVDGIAPGKYTTQNGGKAYMVVHPDGTGTYYNKAGEGKNLTAAAVKKNHAAGMNKFHADVAEGESSAKVEATPAEKKAYAKALKKKQADFSLDEGTYYNGHPTLASTTIYEVKDGKTKAYQNISSVKDDYGDTLKVGNSYPLHYFKEGGAPVGTEFSANPLQGYKPEVEKGVKWRWSGTEWDLLDAQDGVILSLSTADTLHPSAVKEKFFTPEFLEKALYYQTTPNTAGTLLKVGDGTKVKSENVPATTLYKLAASGGLQDKYGNSIVPEDHQGMVSFLGEMHATHDLVALKNKLDSGETDIKDLHQKLGSGNPVAQFKFNVTSLDTYAKDFHGAEAGQPIEQVYATRQAALKSLLDNLTEGYSAEVPTTDAAALFEKDSFGNFKKPLPTNPAEYGEELAWHSTTGQYSKYIKQISDNFGGGGIIGLHYTKMSKDEKSLWTQYLDAGNFHEMYQIEMLAAAKEGKPHGSGYLHPGYTGNVETHKVTWGPAVEGEKPASEKIEGDWSSNAQIASKEEINNYLIKASMMNPTQLTDAERRNWVHYHRNGQQKFVDQLSTKALIRANQNLEPLTPPLEWTDNVQPGKTYNYKFDETQFPQHWGAEEATDYLKDHPELQADAIAYFNEHKSWQDTATTIEQAAYYNDDFLNAHFKKLADEEYQKSLIPVYTLDAQQTVEQGFGVSYNVSDQFGNKFIFKPAPANSKGGIYRPEAEHAGNLLGRLLGFQTAKSALVEMDIKGVKTYGQMQTMVPDVVASMKNYDYSTLTPQQIADISAEHMLDWFLDNDDTHQNNMLANSSGRMIGIDKGRAFKHFGAWNGLSVDGMNSNAHTVYSQMYQNIQNGMFSKEDIDQAYLTARKRIQRMMKVQDDAVAEILAEGMKNRKMWDVSYVIDGKAVSNDYNGLLAAVLDRKSHLMDDFEKVWAGVYKKAKFGDLPEPPVHVLGEDLASGLTDQYHLDQTFLSKSVGHSTMVGGANIIGGHATSWTEQDTQGNTIFSSEMFLAPKAQNDLVSTLKTMVDPTLSEQDNSKSPFHYDFYGQTLLAAAKTINHHAADGEYNQQKITAFEQAQKDIAADLTSFPVTPKKGAVNHTFPSGNSVPVDHLGQYRLMLEFYKPHIEAINIAKDKQDKTEPHHLALYQPLTLEPSKKYTHPNGAVLIPTTVGTYIFVDQDGMAKTVGGADDAVAAIIAGEDGWVSSAVVPEEAPTHKYKVKLNSETYERAATLKDGIKKHTSGEHLSQGASGKEYEVVLPTGESIFYRDASTHAVTSQQGKLTARFNAANPETAAISMANVEAALTDLGINVTEADLTSLELSYWREMYSILNLRGGTSNDSKKWKDAKKAFQQKVAEFGGKPNQFIEGLNEKLGNEGEVEWWRDFYSEYFPTEVQDLINEEGFRPTFQHQLLDDPDIQTGKPIYRRLDWKSEWKKILASDKIAYHSTHGSSVKNWVTGGGLLASEERLRVNGAFGGGMSPGSDQTHGSSHSLYFTVGESSYGWSVMLNPQLALATRVYSSKSDSYGDLAQRNNHAPHEVSSTFQSGAHEMMVPYSVSFLDGIEIVVVDDAEDRDYIIQEFKKRGITEIRGLSIEERFVTSNGRAAAMAKVKALWEKEYNDVVGGN